MAKDSDDFTYPAMEIVSENHMEEAIHFTRSKQFVYAIDDFVRFHEEEFLHLQSRHTNVEIPHRLYELFQEYQELIENLFAEFTKTHGISVRDLCRSFRDTGR